MPRPFRFVLPALGIALSICLSGCAVVEPTVEGSPRGVIQRALAFCGEKTEAAETRCVREALSESQMTVATLVAMLPGCRMGSECTLQYQTRDRAGLLAATATSYIFDWRVTFDLKKPSGTRAADVPMKVLQI